MKFLRAAKFSAFKNHPRNILRDENHLYRILLGYIVRKTALNTTKCLQVAGYKFLKIVKTQILDSLSHSLTTVASLEPKRSSAQSPFYATITNSPVGCAFWGSDECVPSAPCLVFIFNQAACLLLHPTKSYRGVNFPYQHFL